MCYSQVLHRFQMKIRCGFYPTICATERNRTADASLFKQSLYLLSYGGILKVLPSGIEPDSPGFQSGALTTYARARLRITCCARMSRPKILFLSFGVVQPKAKSQNSRVERSFYCWYVPSTLVTLCFCCAHSNLYIHFLPITLPLPS